MKSYKLRWTAQTMTFALALGACSTGASNPEERLSQVEHEIVHGTAATEADILGTVALFHEGDPLCSGTLISPTMALTAAHCMYADGHTVADPGALTVVAGALDANLAASAQIHQVTKSFTHPEFVMTEIAPGYGGAVNDIALVTFEPPVESLSPVPTLPANLVEEALSIGNAATIAGYGMTDPDPAFSDGPVLLFGQTLVADVNEHEFVLDSEGGPGTCFGDSGGPVYVDVGGVTYVTGVTSRGLAEDFDDACNGADIFTLVPSYQDWLDAPGEGLSASEEPEPEDEQEPEPNETPAEDDSAGDLESEEPVGDQPHSADEFQQVNGCSTSGLPAQPGGWLVLLGLGVALAGRRRP